MNKISLANIIVFDINACVKNPEKGNITLQDVHNKILILDITSSTSHQVRQYVEKFAASTASVIFLAGSGLKHQQFGADKNNFGVVRVIAKEKPLVKRIYDDLKKSEPPLDSQVSHTHRRYYKKLGLAPVTTLFINKPVALKPAGNPAQIAVNNVVK